ncbi:hypothetical protein ACFVT5_14395 [Streptomyces sp. NPDC058001]|uniref:hypothetical protein n=1 Tax=Streptomyces sp. NPDC058001 TaxID=3346300 RepID=UPI0036E6E95A
MLDALVDERLLRRTTGRWTEFKVCGSRWNTASGRGRDLIMERVVDLDQAAAVIAERAARWLEAGLTVGEVTWRDEAAPWSQQLETDRELVRDPDSVGVLISGPADAELSLVLFRGGWADVDFVAGLDDAGTLLAFGTQLDQWVPRVVGKISGK